MTIDEFVDIFTQEVKESKTKWLVRGTDGALRQITEDGPNPDFTRHCPISFVAMRRFPERHFGYCEYLLPSKLLELERVEEIVGAADNLYFADRKLQTRLIAAAGLGRPSWLP
jgi:hypothetical protein